MCCTRLAENTGRKKSTKIRHVGMHHRTTLSGYIFTTRIDNRKKIAKQQYLPHMLLQYKSIKDAVKHASMASVDVYL